MYGIVIGEILRQKNIGNNDYKTFAVKGDACNPLSVCRQKTDADVQLAVFERILHFGRITLEQFELDRRVLPVECVDDGRQKNLRPDMSASNGKGAADKTADVHQLLLQIALDGNQLCGPFLQMKTGGSKRQGGASVEQRHSEKVFQLHDVAT